MKNAQYDSSLSIYVWDFVDIYCIYNSRFPSLGLSADGQQVSMANIEFKRKDKRNKCKKLKLFTSTAPNSKVRPQISFKCSNSLI